MSKSEKKDLTSILGFLKYQLSKRLFKGFKIIASPCCDVDIESIDYTCVSASGTNGVLDIIITLDRSINLLGIGKYTATWTIASRDYSVTGDFTDGDTITINDLTLPDNVAVTTKVTLFLPTNYTGDVGASTISATFASTIPNCV